MGQGDEMSGTIYDARLPYGSLPEVAPYSSMFSARLTLTVWRARRMHSSTILVHRSNGRDEQCVFVADGMQR